MSKLKDDINALNANERFQTCHRWSLVCDDDLLSAQCAVRNYQELSKWIEIYYEKGNGSLHIFINNLFHKISSNVHHHQKDIDDTFAHMAKLQREFDEKQERIEKTKVEEAMAEAAKSEGPPYGSPIPMYEV